MKTESSSQLYTVKLKIEKKSGLNEIWTHDLCDTGAYIFIIYGCIANSPGDHVPVGLIAYDQLGEHCTGIAEIIKFRREFFSGLISQLTKLCI